MIVNAFFANNVEHTLMCFFLKNWHYLVPAKTLVNSFFESECCDSKPQ